MLKKMTVLAIFLAIAFSAVCIEAKTIKLSWSPNTESNLAGYKIYWGATYAEAQSKAYFVTNIIGKTCACVNVDEKLHDVIFVGVTAYDTSGKESDATIGYVLFGNITNDYNDATPYTSARVDGMDLTTLGVHFGETVTHPQYDCNSNFTIQLPTEAQRCDLNKDGRIDGMDLIELGLRFGNKAN